MKDNKAFWNKAAKLYTKGQQKSNQKTYDDVCSYIKNYLTRDMIAIELAAGTGQFSLPLHESVKYYVASDYSEKMIEELNKIAHHEDLVTKVIDCTNINCDDNTFDVVIIANCLHIIPNPEQALAEIKRILKPHGLLIAPTFIYEGKINKPKLWFLSRLGFKTYHKWTSLTYKEFITENGFHVIDIKNFPSKIATECLLIANK